MHVTHVSLCMPHMIVMCTHHKELRKCLCACKDTAASAYCTLPWLIMEDTYPVLLVWMQITETRPAADIGQVAAAIPHQIAGTQHEGITEASSASQHHVRRKSSTEADHAASGDLYPTTTATKTMAEVYFYSSCSLYPQAQHSCCCSHADERMQTAALPPCRAVMHLLDVRTSMPAALSLSCRPLVR